MNEYVQITDKNDPNYKRIGRIVPRKVSSDNIKFIEFENGRTDSYFLSTYRKAITKYRELPKLECKIRELEGGGVI